MEPRDQIAAGLELIDDFRDRLSALNDEPNTAILAQQAQTPSDHPDTDVSAFARRGILTLDERVELMRALRKLDTRSLYAAFYKQASKEGHGSPAERLDGGGWQGGHGRHHGRSRDPEDARQHELERP